LQVPNRKAAPSDRRFDDRHQGDGLIICIGGSEAPVIDVSIGGLKFIRPGKIFIKDNTRIAFSLRSCFENPDTLISGTGVVKALHPDWVAIEFVRPTFVLLRTVSRHIGHLLVGHGHLFHRPLDPSSE
jgi:hypothetical protein